MLMKANGNFAQDLKQFVCIILRDVVFSIGKRDSRNIAYSRGSVLD